MSAITGKQSIVVVLTMCTISAAFAETDLSFRDAYPLERPGIKGEARLSTELERARIGDRITLDLSYINRGVGGRFFNPFFNGLLPYPAVIALYDSDQQYLGDLLERDTIGSRRTPSAGDRVFIPGADGYVGTTFRIRAGRIPGRASSPEHALRPGRYYLQAVFYNAFIDFTKEHQPGMTLEEVGEFYDDFDRSELFRSNVVEIELVAAEEEGKQEDEQTE